MLPVGSPATGDDFVDRERETAFKLNHDFYVASETPGELRFYSKMLRDWWRIYYAGTW